MTSGRAGIDYFPASTVIKAIGMERPHLIQEEVRAAMEEGWASRMVGTGSIG